MSDFYYSDFLGPRATTGNKKEYCFRYLEAKTNICVKVQ